MIFRYLLHAADKACLSLIESQVRKALFAQSASQVGQFVKLIDSIT